MDKSLDINFDSLLKQGFGVIDVRYRDYAVTEQTFKYVIVQFEGDRDEFYPNMIRQYVKAEIKEKDIFGLWVKILGHKLSMSHKLKRDVSIRVAALDFAETEAFTEFTEA